MGIESFLTPRLRLIISKVPRGAKIVDVGTDHAYIPIYLSEKNSVNKALATDINEGPLKRARDNIENFNLADKIDTVLSNGLENVQIDDFDCIIIAGMGGVLISEIIEKEKFSGNETLILQPMTAINDLRFFLYANGFEIIDEELTAEGNKIYNVIVAKKGSMKPFEEIDLYIGKKLIENNDPLLGVLLEKQIKKIETIIKGHKNAKGKDTDAIEYYVDLLSALKNLKDKY